MDSTQFDENFLIFQSPDHFVSVFDITKVTLTYDNHRFFLDILRVNEAWLSKDHLCNASKMCASEKGWTVRDPAKSVIKGKCFKTL